MALGVPILKHFRVINPIAPKKAKNVYSFGLSGAIRLRCMEATLRKKTLSGLLYMSTSCQPGSRLIRAFSDVEKPLFIFWFCG